MTKIQNTKQYDLEERTLGFAKKVRTFVKKLPRTIPNLEDTKQIIRSSGSIGANYIEAKESRYWLELLATNGDKSLENERSVLIKEATELTMIFGSIVRKFT